MQINESVDLTGKSLEEIRAIAVDLGIKPHHKASAQTICKQIMQQPKANAKEAIQRMDHVAAMPAAAPIQNSQDDVLQAIKAFLAKPGFEAKFPDDSTWFFSCRGAEESGHLSVPLRVIKSKAEQVSHGRRQLRGLGKDLVNGTYGDNILLA